jgi:hypothetical protein
MIIEKVKFGPDTFGRENGHLSIYALTKNKGVRASAGLNTTTAPTLIESHSSFQLGFHKAVRIVNF